MVRAFLFLLLFINIAPVAADFSEEALHAHIASLQHDYLPIENPRLMVFFSGTPGMGKTTLACYLEELFYGIRISNDEARGHLKRAINRPHVNDADLKLREHIFNLVAFLNDYSPNHLFIMDSSVDRDEALVAKIVKSYGYEMFLIRLEVPKDHVIERLKKREKDPSVHLSRLDRWWDEYQSVDLKYVDYFFDASRDFEELDLAPLVQALQEKLQTIKLMNRDRCPEK